MRLPAPLVEEVFAPGTVPGDALALALGGLPVLRLWKDVLQILLQPVVVHGHLHHLAERVSQLIELVVNDAQHPLGGFEALVDVGVVADPDATLPIIDGETERVLADHAHRCELHLQ